MEPVRRQNIHIRRLQRFYQFCWVVAILWAVELVDRLFFGSRLQMFGIYPGNWNHWEGIFFAPFLHGGWAHVIGNSIWLLIFGAIILRHNSWEPIIAVTIYAVLGGGLVIMLLGTPGIPHIGASIVVYGYWAYIIVNGFYERTGSAILLSVIVIYFFHGMAFTMFPNEYTTVHHISWEGHLGGALGGFLAAKQGV